jgi:hypothetical protein
VCTSLAPTQRRVGHVELDSDGPGPGIPRKYSLALVMAHSDDPGALVLFVYLAWPWLQKPWEDLTSSWLQQIHLPQASATNAPSGRLHVYRQRTDESRIHFEEVGQEEYPRPYPRPILVDRGRGHDVFWWRGECWFLRHNEEPYRFLCVVHGRLQWCW